MAHAAAGKHTAGQGAAEATANRRLGVVDQQRLHSRQPVGGVVEQWQWMHPLPASVAMCHEQMGVSGKLNTQPWVLQVWGQSAAVERGVVEQVCWAADRCRNSCWVLQEPEASTVAVIHHQTQLYVAAQET